MQAELNYVERGDTGSCGWSKVQLLCSSDFLITAQIKRVGRPTVTVQGMNNFGCKTQQKCLKLVASRTGRKTSGGKERWKGQKKTFEDVR